MSALSKNEHSPQNLTSGFIKPSKKLRQQHTLMWREAACRGEFHGS